MTPSASARPSHAGPISVSSAQAASRKVALSVPRSAVALVRRVAGDGQSFRRLDEEAEVRRNLCGVGRVVLDGERRVVRAVEADGAQQRVPRVGGEAGARESRLRRALAVHDPLPAGERPRRRAETQLRRQTLRVRALLVRRRDRLHRPVGRRAARAALLDADVDALRGAAEEVELPLRAVAVTLRHARPLVRAMRGRQCARKRTGMWRGPLMKFERSRSTGPASSMSCRRDRTSLNIARISTRARFAPRQ